MQPVRKRLAAWPATAELAVTNSVERNNAEGPPHTGATNTLGLPCGLRLAYSATVGALANLGRSAS